MSSRFNGDAGKSEALGANRDLREALHSLDPASIDPNYWLRFRGWVMTDAARELARRRLMAELTVADVLNSWSRTVLPTALLAAAMAGVMLMRTPEPPVEIAIGLEELLVSELPAETVPVLLSADADAGIVAFASDEF
jgi:hypothetical protein